jgi:hypothetical protein
MVAARVIWTARLRTGRVADNRANVSRVFRAAALIDLVAEEDSAVVAVIASVAAEALAEEDLADLAEAAAVDSAAAGSGADDKN